MTVVLPNIRKLFIPDPGYILIGGGTGAAAELLIDAARPALKSFVMGAAARPLPEIRRVALGEDAGAIGMALCGADR